MTKHEEVARGNFNQFIQKGNKLSFDELKKLKENWKSDYIATQLLDTQDVNKYIQKVQNKIEYNTEEINILDKDIDRMEEQFYGEDYESKMKEDIRIEDAQFSMKSKADVIVNKEIDKVRINIQSNRRITK